MYFLDDYTENDKNRFLALAKEGTLACFIYSRNYLAGGEVRVFSPENPRERAIQKSEITLVPHTFLSALPDTRVTLNGQTLTVTHGGIILSCSEGTRGYTVNGATLRFSVRCEAKDGCFFVPVLEACRTLGFTARSYNDNRLTLVAPENVHKAMAQDQMLQYAAGGVLMGEYDPYSLTHEDYTLTKDKWRRTIVGDCRINDTSREETRKKLISIERDCERALKILNRDPSAVILFGTEAPTVSRDLRDQYDRLFKLAMAYGAYGNKYYRDESLKEDILFGLEWMYLNMYGEDVIEGKGWRDARLFNWYDWFVGGPDPLTDTMLIMEENLTYEQKCNYLKAFKWITTIHRLENDHPCSMSRVVVCTKMALLLEDPEWLAREYKDYHLLLSLHEFDEGPRIDGCEWTHVHPYNMIYGINNLCRVLKVGSILANTPAEYRSPRQYNLFFLAKYMFEAAMYKGQGMVMFDGRDNSSSEMKNGVAILSYMIPMIGTFGEDEDAYIKRMIKRNAIRPELLERLKSFCSLYNFSVLEDILSDSTIKADGDFTLGHAWFTADRAVQHRNGYCFALAMSSERGKNYESINNANKTGWYTGDGALFLYTDADSHAFDGVNFISSEDISYRIPGTTVDTQKREVKSLRSGWRMPRAFVGSMQIHREFVVAAMDYESYHFEGPYDETPDTGYGGSWPLHNNDLVAKKSWFMLDGECICLGAGISSTTGFEVNTVVEHRRLVKENGTVRGIEDITLDGVLLPNGEYEIRKSGARTLNVEGFAGFVFPDGQDLYINKYQRQNAPTRCEYFGELGDDGKGKPYFEARIEHGRCPTDAKYAYIVVPGATEERLSSELDRVKILSNTPTLQAVYAEEIGLTSAVFWQAGSCGAVNADTPCLVMLREKKGEITLSVCDPTQKATGAVITVDRKMSLCEKDERLTVTPTDRGVRISVDFDGSYSRNLVAKFKINN